MYKLETLTVPVELGEWLQSRELGESGAYFSTIDALFIYWDSAPNTLVFDFISRNKKELIEVILGTRGYRVKKEPLYYALVKGHEILPGGVHASKYWKYDTLNYNHIFIDDIYTAGDRYITKLSISSWNKLGVNESNADFVKVEEMTE